MTTRAIETGNGERLTRSIVPNADGTFTAVAFTKSRDFKTQRGAERWLNKVATK